MAKTSVREKIAAMLRLASDEGATESERASAMSKAQKLLLEHNLAMDDVAMDGDRAAAAERELVHHRLKVDDGFEWRWDLLIALADSNLSATVGSAGWRGRGTIHLLGRQMNVQVVEDLYHWLCQQLESIAAREMREYFFPPQQRGFTFDRETGQPVLATWQPKGSEDEDAWRDGFFHSAIGRIDRRLQTELRKFTADTGTSLVIDRRRENDGFVTEEFGELGGRRRKVMGRAGRRSGKKAGDKVQLGRDTPVGGAEKLRSLGAGS